MLPQLDCLQTWNRLNKSTLHQIVQDAKNGSCSYLNFVLPGRQQNLISLKLSWVFSGTGSSLWILFLPSFWPGTQARMTFMVSGSIKSHRRGKLQIYSFLSLRTQGSYEYMLFCFVLDFFFASSFSHLSFFKLAWNQALRFYHYDHRFQQICFPRQKETGK